jgi:hypothetical protein
VLGSEDLKGRQPALAEERGEFGGRWAVGGGLVHVWWLCGRRRKQVQLGLRRVGCAVEPDGGKPGSHGWRLAGLVLFQCLEASLT